MNPLVLPRTQLMSFSRVPALITSRKSSSPGLCTITSSTNVPSGERIADGQPGCIVHGDVLNRGQRSAGFLTAVNSNVPHVAHVKYADASAHCLVFRDQIGRDT